MTCVELAARLAAGALLTLVDVRTPAEHALVALPGSRLMPLHALDAAPDAAFEPLQGQEVVVYCHHGVRSLHGAAFLRARGVDAVSLAGGIDAWSREIDASVLRY